MQTKQSIMENGYVGVKHTISNMQHTETVYELIVFKDFQEFDKLSTEQNLQKYSSEFDPRHFKHFSFDGFGDTTMANIVTEYIDNEEDMLIAMNNKLDYLNGQIDEMLLKKSLVLQYRQNYLNNLK